LRRGAAVVVAGLALYVALPAFTRTLASWPRLSAVRPWWLVLVVGAEAASFVCAIALLRLVTRGAGWFAATSALLVGNAVTNTVPGGDAIGAGVTFRILAAAGVTLTALLRALERWLAGHPRTVIDGFTPEQRFFLANAQAFCQNIRPETARLRVQIDPHSPNPDRPNGVMEKIFSFFFKESASRKMSGS
jgi:hypothetical protein